VQAADDVDRASTWKSDKQVRANVERIDGQCQEALSAPSAASLLRRGLDAALADPENGRVDLRAALAASNVDSTVAGRLVAAAALVQSIGIADDDYTGFEEALDVALAERGSLTAVDDAEHRLVAQTGLLIADWFRALDDPLLPAQADALARALGDETLRPSVRCCAGLTALAYHVARFNLEGVLWVELMMRLVLAEPTLPRRTGAGPHDRPPHELAALLPLAQLVAQKDCQPPSR